MDDFGSCHACKASYTKPNAKFCNKCGEKRHGLTTKAAPAPAAATASTLNPRPSVTSSSASAPPSASRPPPATTVPAPQAVTSPPTSSTAASYKISSNSTPAANPLQGSVSQSDSSMRDSILDTLEVEEDDTEKYNAAMATLGPNGITPEMLQTSNSEELRAYKKGLLLGRGTYGSVFLGLLPDGSFHAVKTVELGGKSGGITPKELVSLSREINLLRRLKHRNLCTFKGVFYDANTTSINMFMEYVGGGSMTAVVKNFKPLPPDVIRQWTKQLLTGLLYLHTQRIIHRDIKGENILIDTSSDPAKEAQIKLVDFGAAKRLTDAVAQSRTIIGTPYWMAPEIVDLSGEGGGYSYKADVWSVGCTVAEMITGRPPWPAKSNVPQAIMMIAQCEGLPSEMPKVEDGATLGCIDFMTKCFTRDPNARPTVEELMEHPWIVGTMA